MNKEFTNSEKILLALLVCAVLYIIYKNCNAKKEGMSDTERRGLSNGRSFTLEFKDDCIKFLNRDRDMVMKIDHDGNLSLTGVIDNIPRKPEHSNRIVEAPVMPLIGRGEGRDPSTEEESNGSMTTMFGISAGTVEQANPVPEEEINNNNSNNNNNNNNNNGNGNPLAGLVSLMGDMEGFNTVGRNDAIEQFASI